MSGDAQPQVTPDRIMQFAFGYAPTLILEAAIKNRVFDVLDDGPKTIAEVSRDTGASERGLRAIMNALVGLEFLSRDDSGRYSNAADASAFLVTTKPSFFGGLLRHTSEQLLPKWLPMAEIVRTGRPSYRVNEESEGASFFVELVQDIFPMSYRAAQVLGDALGLPSVQQSTKVLDIAAGSGVWGIALAQKSPQVSITAVDWPEVLGVTRMYAERFGLGDRIECVAGDILEASFGDGFDIATLGHILHSEGPERSQKLLKKVAAALKPGGTIAIAEMIPNEDRRGPVFPLIFAVNMLVNTDQGDTFTFGEMSAWLRDSGFTDIRMLEAPSPSPLILATKK
jgi:ubiquinone/menaquinone biosynthesis C-methylase UbiE